MATRPEHGRQISAARSALGLTMDDLAAKTGLHRQSIFNSEHVRELSPRSRSAERIGDAFGEMGVTFETRPDGFAVVFRADSEAEADLK